MLGERYELKRRLGAGGMARVFLAEDTMLGRTVAIKQLHEELGDDEEVRKRFLREARIFARLKHAHIVDIYDILRDDDDDGVAMVMEFIDGADLSTLMRGGLKLVPELAALVMRPVAEALAYAHGEGIVHRDVKPANILLGRDGAVKLSDFGIAKAQEETVLTQTGDFLGTPAYIAPEQARGETVGPAADQYALGAVLFQLVTGQQPFKAPNTLAVLTKIMSGDYPDPRELSDAVDDHLASIIARALSFEPGDRYPDVAAMLGALRAYHHEVSRDRERRLLAELVEDPGTTAEAVAGEVADSMVTTGRAAFDSGDVGRAREAAEAALARSPDHPEARALLARVEDSTPAAVTVRDDRLVVRPRRGPWVVLASTLITAFVGVSIAWALFGREVDVEPVAAPPADASVAVDAGAVPVVVQARDVGSVVDAAKAPDAVAAPRVERPKARAPKKRRRRAARPSKPTPPSPPPPPEPQPLPRAEKNAPLARPAAPGKLSIRAAPWAEVIIDGRSRGRTPYLKELTLKPGRHVLELRNPGFPAHRETVDIVSGQTLERRVRLGRPR